MASCPTTDSFALYLMALAVLTKDPKKCRLETACPSEYIIVSEHSDASYPQIPDHFSIET